MVRLTFTLGLRRKSRCRVEGLMLRRSWRRQPADARSAVAWANEIRHALQGMGGVVRVASVEVQRVRPTGDGNLSFNLSSPSLLTR